VSTPRRSIESSSAEMALMRACTRRALMRRARCSSSAFRETRAADGWPMIGPDFRPPKEI